MTPERKKKLRVILAILFIHSCDWWLGWEYEVCKAKKSRFVPTALAAKEGSWRTEERAGAQSSWEEEGKKTPLWLYCLTVFNCGWMCFYQWLNVFFGQVIDERCGQPKDLESASEGEYSADQAVTSCDTPSRPSQHQPPPPKNSPNPSHFPDYCIPPWPFLPPFMSNITDFVLACSCTFLSLRIRPLLSLLTAALVCRRAGANLQRVSFKSLQTGGGQVGPGEGH